ncbi:calmodulin-binding receptor-like cytoplasmic kinase 2 [Hordeum vulgare subsp. vulgare]|uniref:Protein kinase domain-containing protein n=1 Tax=Hordeum vulgare subsp. vulgare TaxID=112509 RepID=A0A8I6YP69_HORVV|nr:calmodulin-binding receptor-like cytoplasmic kinase 2 [Hordeum vulgare subsp. vulgare]
MDGRDHRRRLSASSSGRRERLGPAPSPAWSQQLSVGSGRARSLFRSIGVWFSSLSTPSSPTSAKKKRPKQLPPPALDDAIKKPPSFGYGTGRASMLRGAGGGLYGGARRSGSQTQYEFQSSVFTMEEILKATSNFSPALKIGQGGFGAVYKGVLPDGTVVAVKRAKQRMQNPHVDVEFRSEVKIMARIEHQSLVRFYGYLEHGEERVVVIEHVPNGTLREHLDRRHGRFLELAARLDVAIDVAHAVTYLHMYSDHPIIHRDIKSSNILLTASLRAKVADFGFARLGAGGLGHGDGGARHVSTQVKGTAGYLDPEYLKTCQLTDRSDVYSFGVLLVEMVSGRRPIEPKREMKERLTARWAMRKLVEGRAAEDVLDPCLLRTSAATTAVEAVLELAFRCMGPVRDERPSMDDCCRALWAVRKTYRDTMSAMAAAADAFSDRASSSSASTGTSTTGDFCRM